MEIVKPWSSPKKKTSHQKMFFSQRSSIGWNSMKEKMVFQNLICLASLLLCICIVTADKDWIFQSEDKWDNQWKAGQWSYMDTVPVERSKVAVVGVLSTMYTTTTAMVGSDPDSVGGMLDVGCGEGSLADFLPSHLREGYVGTDISKEAIHSARRKRPTLKFVHAAAHEFAPKNTNRKFLAITFADMLYYLDHKSILKRYNEFLADDGIVIISIFYQKTGRLLYKNIFDDAAEIFERVDASAMDVSGITQKKAHAAKTTETETAFHIEVYRKRKASK